MYETEISVGEKTFTQDELKEGNWALDDYNPDEYWNGSIPEKIKELISEGENRVEECTNRIERNNRTIERCKKELEEYEREKEVLIYGGYDDDEYKDKRDECDIDEDIQRVHEEMDPFIEDNSSWENEMKNANDFVDEWKGVLETVERLYKEKVQEKKDLEAAKDAAIEHLKVQFVRVEFQNGGKQYDYLWNDEKKPGEYVNVSNQWGHESEAKVIDFFKAIPDESINYRHAERIPEKTDPYVDMIEDIKAGRVRSQITIDGAITELDGLIQNLKSAKVLHNCTAAGKSIFIRRMEDQITCNKEVLENKVQWNNKLLTSVQDLGYLEESAVKFERETNNKMTTILSDVKKQLEATKRDISKCAMDINTLHNKEIELQKVISKEKQSICELCNKQDRLQKEIDSLEACKAEIMKEFEIYKENKLQENKLAWQEKRKAQDLSLKMEEIVERLVHSNNLVERQDLAEQILEIQKEMKGHEEIKDKSRNNEERE